jgi:hypothetical protein
VDFFSCLLPAYFLIYASYNDIITRILNFAKHVYFLGTYVRAPLSQVLSKIKGGSPTALIFIFDNLFLYTSYKSCRKPIAGTGTPFGAS